MANTHGEWIWFELLTSDPDAAQTFYGEVLGWTARPSGMPGIDYRLLHAAGEQVGGLMRMPADMDTGPVWLGYVAVDDVDTSARAFADAGGAIHMPPTTLDGVGRMAMVTDPQGVALHVMRGASDETSTVLRQCMGAADDNALGHVVWCELTTPDPDAAIGFYAGRLGWRQEGGVPMGDLGEYRFLHAAGHCFGAVMGPVPGSDRGWLFYFHVADIDRARDRLLAAGGDALQEPMEIPGGQYSLVARDPQGARFGLVGPRIAHTEDPS
ncbi:VOC family protein [Luteimonas yindakuii]|uniref:VOC family protein n=1 Tax=Luteimonas yindakuii TaxID=2565782 RepID=UPI0010A2C75D|nr:VOC family protein [Luteimonas yindakuii]QCO66695.1 VOC family protein [Luteimonas yindakuii]